MISFATHYIIRATNGDTVICRRGADAPKMTGGGGGWESVARPRRVAFVQWTGRDLYTMDVPVILDGFIDDVSVEDDIARLNGMQMGHDLVEPPKITIEGAVPVKGIQWVVVGIEWGDNVYWETRGQRFFRTRQDAILRLMQYRKEDKMSVRKVGPNLPTSYSAKKGQTLRQIAQDVYGDPDKWRIIARAQKPPLYITGKTKLHKDQRLKIPYVNSN